MIFYYKYGMIVFYCIVGSKEVRCCTVTIFQTLNVHIDCIKLYVHSILLTYILFL